jgi:hypothetical protein
LKKNLLLLLFPCVLGCDSASPDYSLIGMLDPGVTDQLLPPPCLDTACATKTEHLSIFDAENLAFSSDGRLFVSGGEAVYEITEDTDKSLLSAVISAEPCNYTGLEVVGTALYASCGDNRLFSADIGALPLSEIYTVTGTQLANGLAELNGYLYLTDGPISLSSKIIQLTLDPTNPMAVLSQADWTTAGELTSANGLQAVNGELWVTDYNQLKRYEVGSDGSKGSTTTVLTQGVAAFDDFTVLESGAIVMNDFTGNTSLLFSAGGTLLESTTDVLGPSSAIQGQPPMFNSSQIIITEKGTLGDSTEGNGNRMAIFTAN